MGVLGGPHGLFIWGLRFVPALCSNTKRSWLPVSSGGGAGAVTCDVQYLDIVSPVCIPYRSVRIVSIVVMWNWWLAGHLATASAYRISITVRLSVAAAAAAAAIARTIVIMYAADGADDGAAGLTTAVAVQAVGGVRYAAISRSAALRSVADAGWFENDRSRFDLIRFTSASSICYVTRTAFTNCEAVKCIILRFINTYFLFELTPNLNAT